MAQCSFGEQIDHFQLHILFDNRLEDLLGDDDIEEQLHSALKEPGEKKKKQLQ